MRVTFLDFSLFCRSVLPIFACISVNIASAQSVGVTMVDPTSGEPRTSISVGSPVLVMATVRDAVGSGVPHVVVSFVTTSSLGVMIPASGAALTNSSGEATIQLAAASQRAVGATTISATTTINGVQVSGSTGYSVSDPGFAVTVSLLGSGFGAVASTPAGINCGSTCTASFRTDSIVILKFTPATGSTFSGWSGDCTNASDICTLTISAAKNVTANVTTISNLEPGQVNLRVGWNLLGNGSATPLDVLATFGDAAKIKSVWRWNKASNKWAFFSPAMTTSDLTTYAQIRGYDVLTSIASKDGFWVNASKDVLSFPLIPTPALSPLRTVLSERDLLHGWNLVSSADNKMPSILCQRLTSSLNTYGRAMVSIWAWDTQKQRWMFYAPSLESQGGTVLSDYIGSKGYIPFSTALFATDGFWVNIATASTIQCAPTQGSWFASSTLNIQFVSATSRIIQPIGHGNINYPEESLVTFRVVDNAGKPVANQLVDLSGGRYLDGVKDDKLQKLPPCRTTEEPLSSVLPKITDADGFVSVNVSSLDAAGHVSVTATTCTPLDSVVSAQSNMIVINQAPVANAGTNQNVTTGSLVTLNGGASSDNELSALTYSWSLTSKPSGSKASLTGAATALPTFNADLAGTYVASLIVNDGILSSNTATVTITVTGN